MSDISSGADSLPLPPPLKASDHARWTQDLKGTGICWSRFVRRGVVVVLLTNG